MLVDEKYTVQAEFKSGYTVCSTYPDIVSAANAYGALQTTGETAGVAVYSSDGDRIMFSGEGPALVYGGGKPTKSKTNPAPTT